MRGTRRQSRSTPVTDSLASPERDRDPRRPAGSFVLVWSLWSLAWLMLATLGAACAFTFPRSAGADPLLPLTLRLHMVTGELVLLLVPSAVLALLLAAATSAARATASGRGKVLRTVAGAAMGAALLLYASMWSAFLFIGQFPDVRAIDMVASDSWQLVQHALHLDAEGTTLAAVGSLGLALVWSGLLRRVAEAGRKAQASVALAGTFAALAGVAFLVVTAPESLLVGNRVVDPEAGVDMLPKDFYAEALGTRTGPLLRLAAALGERSRLPSPAEGRTALARCRMNPLVTPEQWAAAIDPAPRARRNVILIEIESLRTDQLRSFGGPGGVMPTVEALASEGRVFLRHYTLSSHSNYADIPPLSSHYPLRSAWYHIYPENPPYPRVLIYDLLHQIGYRTAIVSSQNEGWGGMSNYLHTPGLDALLDSRNFEGEAYVPSGDFGFEKFAKGNRRSGKIDDRFTVDRALRWMDESSAGRPFFLYLNLQNSHVPYETPADFDAPFPRPHPSVRIGFNSIPRGHLADARNAYANSLAYIDAQLARLVRHLKDTGRWDETIVVIGGDNGEAFLEHGFSAHASALYDEVVRTPLIIRAPGLDAGTDEQLAATLDIPPSILRLLGLPPHPGFQGRDLFDPPPEGERSVFLVAQTPLAHQYAVVRSGYKLIEDQRSGATMLYDLLVDPGETRNVAEVQASAAADLKQRLDLWVTAQLAYYGDPATYCCRYPPLLPD
jgi:arylsulfatase A-like enzyme